VFFYGKDFKEKDARIHLYTRIIADGERTEISVKRDIETQLEPKKGVAKSSKEETCAPADPSRLLFDSLEKTETGTQLG